MSVFDRYPEAVATMRGRLDRPLTFAEKVLAAHAADPASCGIERGVDSVDYRPDRVLMQDAMAQMTLLQFMTTGRERVAVPASVHCDHLIEARLGATADLKEACDANAEVYEFLRSACAKYGIDFWEPGSGIIHQVALERYAVPGGMMVGTDSHTPNAGGLGMIAIGVGGADAVDVMAGLPFTTVVPRVIGVHLTGALSGWASPKDVILTVAGLLGVSGGTGAIIEYFGPGVASLSATGRATICNMGAEVGATCSVFPFDARTADYLRANGHEEIADAAQRVAGHLRADPEAEREPEHCFDRVLEIDLDDLGPHVTGPHTPALDRPLAELSREAAAADFPLEISCALVGSCTNSSYEDLGRAAHVAHQASTAGLRVRTPLLVTPGSEQIRATVERDGFLADLEAIGATVLANACGPCIGQWRRDGTTAGGANTIVSSFNRNFPRRNDGNPETRSFLASPETVVAVALTGRLDVDFVHDGVTAPDGRLVRLEPPEADDLPRRGFDVGADGYAAPPSEGASVRVTIPETSERLQALEPFPAWEGTDLLGLRVLLKAAGKCTTDQISPAGAWLRYRGHLPNISRNLFVGAVNAFADAPGHGVDIRDGSTRPLAELARAYRDAGIGWVAIGDANYGEGSSREHAAMEPRFLGCRAVIVRSFARIHEANLKRHGVLPLVFANPDDYERVLVDDALDLIGIDALAPDRPVHARLQHADGRVETITTTHTLSDRQITWFRAGSALNVLRADAETVPA